MLEKSQESPQKAQVKRFALKKEISDLKTIKKFYKQYMKQSSQHLQKLGFKKELCSDFEAQIEQYKQFQNELYQHKIDKQPVIYDVDNDSLFKKLSIIDGNLFNLSATSESELTKLLEKPQQKKVKIYNFDDEYKQYIDSLYTEEKKKQCLEWLEQNKS